MPLASRNNTESLSISYRLLLGFSGLSLFILVLIGSVFYFYARDRVSESITGQILHAMKDSTAYFENRYNTRITSDLTVLEAAPSLDNFLTAPKDQVSLIRFDLEKMFARLSTSEGNFYQSILFVDAYGNEKIFIQARKRVRKLTSLANYPQDSLLHQHLNYLFGQLKLSAHGAILASPTFKNPEGGYSFLAGIAKREPEIAGFGGTIIVLCDLQYFLDYLSDIKVFDKTVGWLFSPAGDILLSPPPEEGFSIPEINNAGNQSQPDRQPGKLMPGDLNIHSHDASSGFSIHDDWVHNDDCRVGASTQKIFDIAFSIPHAAFTDLRNELLKRGLAISAAIFLIAVGISFFFARQLTKPLIHLSRLSASFSQGNFDVHFPSDGGGELSTLATSLNRAAKDLKRKIEERDKEIATRKATEIELQLAHSTLEDKVRDRTTELQQTNLQLMHAEKLSAIGNLSASIAHEFNNPLFGIMNALKVICQNQSLNPAEKQLAEMSLKECERMKNLIRDLQDFNRPTSDRMAPMDIHACLDSLLILGKKELSNRQLTVRKNYMTGLPQIVAVADQIKQVLLNLLTNAADACTPGGEITITTSAEETMVVIEISDNGGGIASEHLGRIFDPFFTTKSTVKGTGLGLSVSYGIIKSHQGTIDVSSQQDKGSTFSIRIPIKGERNEETTSPAG